MADDAMKYKIICIDGSKHSDRALDWFFQRVFRKGEEIGIVHIHTLPTLPAFGLYAQGAVVIDGYENDVQKSIDQSKELVKKYRKICEDKGAKVKVFIQTCQESVGQTICNTIQDHASMIILGQRGLGAIRRTLFGSVSDYVIHHAHIPVIVVPPDDTEALNK